MALWRAAQRSKSRCPFVLVTGHASETRRWRTSSNASETIILRDLGAIDIDLSADPRAQAETGVNDLLQQENKQVDVRLQKAGIVADTQGYSPTTSGAVHEAWLAKYTWLHRPLCTVAAFSVHHAGEIKIILAR